MADWVPGKSYVRQTSSRSCPAFKGDGSLKLAVTSQGTSLASPLDPRFGRCEHFVIIDADTEEFEAFSNESVMASGGAGSQSAQFLANKDVEAVVTGNVGPNAAMALEAAGIKVYRMGSGTVKDALDAFRAGTLEAISGPTVGSHHGMGGRRRGGRR